MVRRQMRILSELEMEIQKGGFVRSIISIFLLAVSAIAFAGNLEDLAREGYGVVDETRVDGEFEGCEYDRRIPLANGLVFVCSEYNYSYSYSPEVLILRHVQSGAIKVLIDEEEYDGTIYRSR